MVRLFISIKYTGGLRKEYTGVLRKKYITGIWEKISKKDEVKGLGFGRGGKSNFKIHKQIFVVKPKSKVGFTGFTW